MDDFYTRLARELKKSEKDIWVETVLTGEHAGEKRILAGEEADAGDVAEGGPAVPAGQAGKKKNGFSGEGGPYAETDCLRRRPCVHAHHPDRKDAGIFCYCAGRPAEICG